MPFYFSNFPTTEYDLKGTGSPNTVTDISLRYRILEALKNKVAIYYDYLVPEGERPDVIAYKYYGDSSLDWIIFLANDIIDPQYDWPLSYDQLIEFIRGKYGSSSAAQSQVHHYEWIYRNQSVTFDNVVIPEKVIEVDLTTYNTLSPNARRSVSAFEYEIGVNDAKRRIKLIDKDYLQSILSSVDGVFN